MASNGAERRSMARWLYILIPAGFVLLVVAMLLIGQPTGGPVEGPDVVTETEPLDASPSPANPEMVVDPVPADDDKVQGEPVVPTLSGPEGRDGETIIE